MEEDKKERHPRAENSGANGSIPPSSGAAEEVWGKYPGKGEDLEKYDQCPQYVKKIIPRKQP